VEVCVYVRLANAWTDQNGARHQAGDTVEVDNVTLAELEAGGYVTTNEEEVAATPATKGWPGAGSEPAEDPTAKKTTTETTTESGGDDGIAKPDSDGWPGAG
jgi:hypothetical protein